MEVKKSNNSLEEFDPQKVYMGICEAYNSCGEECPEDLIESLIKNLFIYDRISTSEIRRQVEECLMSINKKVAKSYIGKYENDKELLNRDDFIHNYIKATNASTGSKYDSNANVSNKNIATLNAEIPKGGNIRFNRYNTSNKIANMYSKKLAKQYISDLENHIMYKHDESSFGLNSPYTYSAKEVIEVKYNDKHLMLPFDLLWDVLDEEEVLVNKLDDVYQKYPNNLYVKDMDNVFTHVTVMTKKLRKRDLVRVKTAFGEDVVVTDNHPMIIDKENVNDTIQAIDSLNAQQYKLGNKLEFGSVNEIDMASCPDIQEVSDVYCISYNGDVFRRKLIVDAELGYLIGFFVGDGNYNNGKNGGSIVFTQKDRNKLVQLNEILFNKFGYVGRIRYKRDKTNCFNLTISQNSLWWVLNELFKIQDKSENKTLPYNLLEYNEEFSKGLVSGLIDADGTINDCQISVRLSSRAAILQLTSLLRHFNYGVGNIIQNLPFSNNMSYNTNYTLWGVNCSVRTDSTNFDYCDKLKKARVIEHSVKYKNDGYVTITNITKISENDAFLGLNEYIYDITTDTHTFECNNLLVHNCVAIQSYPFLTDGIKGLGGLSAAPKNIDSFCGMFVNLIFAVSSQFAGAVAVSGFFNMFDYYARKEWGDNYYIDNNRPAKFKYIDGEVTEISIDKQIEQYFQEVVYSINQPAAARGFQSAFTNFAYFDKPYFDGMYGSFVFPDGTKPQWESISWLQKKFMKWFNKERTKCVLTFPVETMSLLYKDGKFVDEEYADFTAEMYAEGHSFFTYISDSPDTLSSCCRLSNKIQENTFSFTNGLTGESTGSKSVITLNYNRIVQNFVNETFNGDRNIWLENKDEFKEKFVNYLIPILERIYRYHTAYNEILWDLYEANMLPVYSAGFIHLNKQYLTIGLNGVNEAWMYLGGECRYSDDYKEFCNLISSTMRDQNALHRTRKTMFNSEYVPAESLGIKNYNWDKNDGYWIPEDRNCYTSYFFLPDDDNVSVLEKMQLHGKDFVSSLDGGSACHINLKEHLSFEQYRHLLNFAGDNGTNYFTFNVKNSACRKCGYISKHTLKECPHCGSDELDYYTRIIGYLIKVNSFNEGRQIEEKHRIYS